VLPDPTGNAVCVEVIDRGTGISGDDLERIFDPFFTTRRPGGGPGLGLTLCHRIVSDHGGSMQVRSREGQGSRFGLSLPRRLRAQRQRSGRIGSPRDFVGYSRSTGVGGDLPGVSFTGQE
jgi:K+-sensing histidine kinase KdpD